jgi:DNA-binding LytR/AlgR family response regulator
MKPLKAIAIDDEVHALDLISLYAEKSELVSLSAKADNPHEARKLLESEPFDIVFLDIQMPELTGLQLLDLSSQPLNVVITSAYPKYALDGYKYNVCDYLLKPFSFERFEEAVKRVASKNGEIGKTAEESSFITLKGDGKGSFHRVDPSGVLFIEGMRNYASFYLESDRIVSLLTLTEAEAILPSNFLRIHRSFIVNLNKIERLEGHSVYIGEKLIPIGKTYRDEVMKRLGV